MRRQFTVFIMLSGAGMCGCSQIPKDAGFDSVRQTVARRTGQVVQWRGESGEDAAVDTAVRSMLSKPIDADQAVQIALLNNRGLQATFEELGVAQADLVQAGLLRNPVFSVGVRFPNRPPSKTYLNFDVAEDFLDLFFVPARRKIAEADFEATKARVTGEVLQLAAQTRAAFYEFAAARQILELRRTAGDAAIASQQAAGRLRDAGNITELALISEQAQGARAALELQATEADLAQARERLNGLMGLSGSELEWTATAVLPELPPRDEPSAELETLADHQRQDLLAARAQVVLQTRALGLVEEAGMLSGGQIGADAERETDGQWRIGPSVSVPVPLFDQGQAAMGRARAQLRQARRKYEALAIQSKSEVRMAAERMRYARRREQFFREHVLPLQRKLVQQTALEYNAMLAGVFVLLQVRRDQIEARREYIESIRDYWVARAELERAIGGRLKPIGPTTMPVSSSQHEKGSDE